MTTPTTTPPSHLHSLGHIIMDNFHSSSASAPTPDGSSGALISNFRAFPLQTRAMEYQPGNNPTATPIQRAFNGNYFPFLFRPRLSIYHCQKKLANSPTRVRESCGIVSDEVDGSRSCRDDLAGGV